MEVPPLTEPVGVDPPSPKVSQHRPDVRHRVVDRIHTRAPIEPKPLPGGRRLPLAQIEAELADLERQRRAATSSRAAALITSAIHERYAEAGLLARASGIPARSTAPAPSPQDTRRSA